MSRHRFKHFLRERNEFSANGEETLLSVSEYYGVKPRADAFDGDRSESRAESLEGYRIVKEGDLVMNYMLAWKGAYGLSAHHGITSPAYAVFDVDTTKVDRRFLHHRTRSKDMQVEFRAKSKGIIESRLRLYPDALLAMQVDLPDLLTQKRIAAFLDRETARIDELIAKKERLFQLLTEHLRASFDGLFLEGIATHAAFTSLPFHWMPRLPASWTLTKLKYLGEKGQKTTQMGPFGGMLTQLLQTDTGFKLYGQENTISRDFSKGSRWVSEATFRELSRYELKPGDIMLTRKGTLGKCASFPSGAVRGIADSDTIRIRLNHSLFSHWMLENTLQYASYVSEQIALEKRGAILAGLNTSIIDNLLIAVPPMNEQQKIAAFGTKMLEKNSSLRENLISSIDRLKEYRAALITAAVTGQINVDTYGKTGTTSATLDKIEEEMQA